MFEKIYTFFLVAVHNEKDSILVIDILLQWWLMCTIHVYVEICLLHRNIYIYMYLYQNKLFLDFFNLLLSVKI